MDKYVCQNCGLEKEHRNLSSQCVECDEYHPEYANRDASGKPITVLENEEFEW